MTRDPEIASRRREDHLCGLRLPRRLQSFCRSALRASRLADPFPSLAQVLDGDDVLKSVEEVETRQEASSPKIVRDCPGRAHTPPLLGSWQTTVPTWRKKVPNTPPFPAECAHHLWRSERPACHPRALPPPTLFPLPPPSPKPRRPARQGIFVMPKKRITITSAIVHAEEQEL